MHLSTIGKSLWDLWCFPSLTPFWDTTLWLPLTLQHIVLASFASWSTLRLQSTNWGLSLRLWLWLQVGKVLVESLYQPSARNRVVEIVASPDAPAKPRSEWFWSRVFGWCGFWTADMILGARPTLWWDTASCCLLFFPLSCWKTYHYSSSSLSLLCLNLPSWVLERQVLCHLYIYMSAIKVCDSTASNILQDCMHAWTENSGILGKNVAQEALHEHLYERNEFCAVICKTLYHMIEKNDHSSATSFSVHVGQSQMHS